MAPGPGLAVLLAASETGGRGLVALAAAAAGAPPSPPQSPLDTMAHSQRTVPAGAAAAVDESRMTLPCVPLSALAEVSELDAARARCEELEARTTKAELHHYLKELRARERRLAEVVREEATASREWEQRLDDAERRRTVQECRLRSLRVEVADVRGDLDALRDEERHLTMLARDATSTADRCERWEAEDSVLSGEPADWAGWVGDVQEREGVLRELEDKTLTVEDLIEQQMLELERLQAEHDGMQREGTGSAVVELQQSRKVASSLTQRLSGLQERLREAEARKAMLTGHAAELEAEAEELRAEERRQLERLANERRAQDRSALSLHAELEEATAPARSDAEMRQLEEAMLLLKACGVNLATDTDLIRDVNEHWCTQLTAPRSPSPQRDGATPSHPAVQGLANAYRFLRNHVQEFHGQQRAGERWLLRRGDEPPEDEHVRGLLFSLKAMAICFDAIPQSAHRQIPYAREIVLNVSILRDMVTELAVRDEDMQRRDRDAQVAAEKEYQERVRRAVMPASVRRKAAKAANPESPG